MDCHDSKDVQQGQGSEKKKGGHGGHMLMMVLCCGLPILVVALLPAIIQFNPSLGKFLGSYAWALCPILMIPMVFMMLGSHKKDHS